MQQLAEWKLVSAYTNHSIMQWYDDIYIEDFNLWAEQFCRQYEFKSQEIALGADRAQLHFQVEGFDFLLCYEALSESLWIEGHNAFANQNIQLLAQLMSKDTLVHNEHM